GRRSGRFRPTEGGQDEHGCLTGCCTAAATPRLHRTPCPPTFGASSQDVDGAWRLRRSTRAGAVPQPTAQMATTSPQVPDPTDTPEAEEATSRPKLVRRLTAGSGLIAVLLLLWFFAAGEMPDEGAHIGFWSLLPALTTLALVFITRE